MSTSGRLRVAVLAVSDCLLLYGAWAAVTFSYHLTGFGQYEPSFYLRMWPMGPAFVAVNYLFRLYHGSLLYPAAPLSPVEELRRLFGSALLTHIGLIAVLALMRQTTEDYSRFVIAVSGMLVALLAQPFRDLVRKGMAACGIGRIPVFLVGGGAVADRIANTIAEDSYLGFSVVGRFSDDSGDKVV